MIVGISALARGCVHIVNAVIKDDEGVTHADIFSFQHFVTSFKYVEKRGKRILDRRELGVPFLFPFEREIAVVSLCEEIFGHIAERKRALSGEREAVGGDVLEVQMTDEREEIVNEGTPIVAVGQAGMANVPDKSEVFIFSASRRNRAEA